MRPKQSAQLRLIRSEESSRQVQAIEEWLLGSAPDPLPDDERLVARLDGAPPAQPWEFRTVVDRLVAEGLIHPVHIGSRRHLTRLAERVDSAAEEEQFRLQVELDLETEKQLLLKTGLTLELIALMLVGREVFLRWFGS